MISLVVEASTYEGSTALLDGSSVLGARAVAMRGRDLEALMPAVAELLSERHIAPEQIDRIVCGAGPGSFTSLRIAGSIAKGLALAYGASLIPVSSLALLVASRELQQPGRYLAAVDAMRGEQYVQLFEADADGGVLALAALQLVATTGVDRIASEFGAIALGPSRHGSECAVPIAAAAVRLTKLIDATPPADMAAWEPAYGRLAEAQVKWEAVHGRPLQAR